MAMTIKVLALDLLGNGTGMAAARMLYQAPSTPVAKSALVKTMSFTNVASSGNVKLNLFLVPNGSNYPTTSTDPHFRLLAVDQPLGAGYEILDDVELTLSDGDAVYATATNDGSNPAPTGEWIHFAVAGLEQDA